MKHIKLAENLVNTFGIGDVEVGEVEPEVVSESARTRIDTSELTLLLVEFIFKVVACVNGDTDSVALEILHELVDSNVVVNETCIAEL